MNDRILSREDFLDTLEELIWKATNRETTSREYHKLIDSDETLRKQLEENEND